MKKLIAAWLLSSFLVTGCTKPSLEKQGLGSIPLPVSIQDMDTEIEKEEEEQSPRGTELLAAMTQMGEEYKILSINDEEGNLTESWWFTGGESDTGFELYGDRFTITVVESEVSGIFNADPIITEYIASLPEYKQVTEAPVTSKTQSIWWTSFIVYTMDPESKIAVEAEQYTLIQMVDKAYSMVINLKSLDEAYKTKALETLAKLKLPNIVYDETVQKAAIQLDTKLTAEKMSLYDATVINALNIIVAVREYQDKPLAILVKTLKNGIDEVINYGARLGTDEGIRFDMRNTKIIGEFPEVRYLTTVLEPDAQNYNTDMLPLQNVGNADYVDTTTSFLSYLIYNAKEDRIIGIYFEQIVN